MLSMNKFKEKQRGNAGEVSCLERFDVPTDAGVCKDTYMTRRFGRLEYE
jgi:hypothetical protein